MRMEEMRARLQEMKDVRTNTIEQVKIEVTSAISQLDTAKPENKELEMVKKELNKVKQEH